jgi:hypothetical protein
MEQRKSRYIIWKHTSSMYLYSEDYRHKAVVHTTLLGHTHRHIDLKADSKLCMTAISYLSLKKKKKKYLERSSSINYTSWIVRYCTRL